MESVADRSSVQVRCYRGDQAGIWKDFLATSNNSTLFHDLDFLSYHPEGKFECHHLLFYQNDDLVALLPAAIVEKSVGKPFLMSPYGASVGGLVLPPRMKVALMLEIIRALQSYASESKLAGIQFRLAPSSYLREPGDLSTFALQLSGFTLDHSSLVFMLPLCRPADELVNQLFSATKRNNVRSSLKQGIHPREVGIEKLDEFYEILVENNSLHEATPTHSKDDLAHLFRLVPQKVRLFMGQHEGREIAGILLFEINDRVATTFYICERQSHKQKIFSPAVLIAHLVKQMAEEGFRYLDLGPSISDTHCNSGAVFFKESLGAEGFARQTWTWVNPQPY
jgi:hypothetical protein